MSPTIVALSLISAIVATGSLVGFFARFHRKMDLEQWTVGGRGFGLVLVWLLMAGEIYTTFTFLGASGWAYSRGGPVLYILGYLPLMYVVSFYILPPIWEAGRKHGFQTQADFFEVRYGSLFLGAFVALVGVVCLIPYLQIQITGLGLIVEVASYGAIHHTPAMIVAFALVAAFIFVSGVRGVAWASIVKDLLLLFAAVFVGFAVPRMFFGGIGPMFAALAQAKPSHLVMPGATKDLGHGWYITSVLLSSFGCYMWPQFFAAYEKLSRLVGCGNPKTEMKFSDLAERWKATVVPTIKATTAAYYKKILHAHVLPMFGEKQIALIGRYDIEAFSWSARGSTAATLSAECASRSVEC